MIGQGCQRIAQIVEHMRLMRLGLERLSEETGRRRLIAPLPRDHAQQLQGIGIVRSIDQDLPE